MAGQRTVFGCGWEWWVLCNFINKPPHPNRVFKVDSPEERKEKTWTILNVGIDNFITCSCAFHCL